MEEAVSVLDSEGVELSVQCAVARIAGGRVGGCCRGVRHDRNQLLGAIRAVVRGDSVVDARVVDRLIRARERAENSPVAQLTPREQQILAEIAQGKSNAAIAGSLRLTKRAVEKHIGSIFQKLELEDEEVVSRRVAAVLLYLSGTADDTQGAAAGRF